MPGRALRVGIIGVGNNAATHHVPAYRLLPQVELAACCAPSRARAEQGAARLGIPRAYTDVATMIRAESLDAVSVCSPNDAHCQNTLDALAAGAHVLCEKPMACDTRQARRMCEAADRAERRNMVGYTYRFVPAARMAHELIAAGDLGELFTFQASYVSAYLSDLGAPIEKPWKLMQGRGGGVLGDLGSHLIYLTRWWFGPVTRAGGVVRTLQRQRALPDGTSLAVDADDACAFTVEFASGLLGSYFVTKYATGRANCQRIEVYGSRGALAYSVERPGELDLCVGPDACRSRRWRTVTAPDRFGDPGSIGSLEAYRLAQARTFVESIRTQTAAEPSFADGLACQEVLDAVVASAAAPAWVSVDRKAS